jgi:hypothetical protein
MEIKPFKLSVSIAAALLAAAVLLFAGPLAGSAWARADAEDDDGPLIDQTGEGGGELIDQGDDEGKGDRTNLGLLECRQVLNQIGGDQYATATGSGEGDVAANNQEFTAEQIQQCQILVGNNNQGNRNGGDETDNSSNDNNDDNNNGDDGDDEGAENNSDDGSDGDSREIRALTTMPTDVVKEVTRTTPLPNTGGGLVSGRFAGAAGAAVALLLGGAVLGLGLLRRDA